MADQEVPWYQFMRKNVILLRKISKIVRNLVAYTKLVQEVNVFEEVNFIIVL